jgi:S-adenosylmethionine:tRNA ribosyltransferase-isomerase
MSDWLAAYDYELPAERIARRPADPRDSSRLLVLDRASGARRLTVFRDLPELLRAGDLLVVNETRVLPARIFTRLERTGRRIEILLSHPLEPEAAGESAVWCAMLGPGRRLRPGDLLRIEGEDGAFVLEGPVGDGLWRLRCENGRVEDWMRRTGHIPLPPYLEREDGPSDREWYQTIYAREEGAVAAPTAGLHFTAELFGRLRESGVGLARILLHVGPGTFLPVRAGEPEKHAVLPERYRITEEAASALERTRRQGGRIVAVGTTTVRALETSAREGDLRPGSGWTGLTILPGHRFRAVDALITNFHLPRSSLLLLVSAFAGRETVLESYRQALEAGFRFYSYGDAMLVL